MVDVPQSVAALEMPVAYSYIRFSTPEQIKGDSLRRQLERSEKYAAEHGLALDTTLRDLGSSGYKGDNLKKGALGKFVAQIKKKNSQVKPGSYLLVESLDRLTRLKVFDALKLFLDIIDSGVTIVTLMDNQVHSRERVDENWTSLIGSIAIMARANEESATKSDRLLRAWNQKVKVAREGGQKLTSKCPHWLKLSEDRTQFIVDEGKAAVVRRIFRMVLDGHGAHTIERTFNLERVPTFGRGHGWHKSYIIKILNSRTVLGEFQHCTGPTRQNDGEPIRDYYPRIVSDRDFYAAQKIRSDKRPVAAGRRGAMVSNLLSGLCKCGYCGGPMVYVNKGEGKKVGKTGRFLVCSGSKRGFGCKYVPLSYPDLEQLLMLVTRELTIEDLSSNRGEVEQLKSAQGKLDTLLKSRANLIEAIEQAPDVTPLVTRLVAVEQEIAVLQKGVEELKSIVESGISPEQRIADLALLREKLDAATGQDLYDLRLRLSSEFKQLFAVVKCFPDGDDLNDTSGEYFNPEDRGKFVGRQHRYVDFVFKDGRRRIASF